MARHATTPQGFPVSTGPQDMPVLDHPFVMPKEIDPEDEDEDREKPEVTIFRFDE